MTKNNQKTRIMFVISILLIILSIALISSATVCCEKVSQGAWCDEQEETLCNDEYNTAPTACDSTSYCRTGCCFDSLEGLCWENTPQRVCDDKGGTWSNSEECAIPQCNLGCCVLGDQGALVTLTRCKKMAGDYGLTTDFRSNIIDEVECVSVAQSQKKGACVYEADFQRLCKFVTRGECSTSGLEGIEGEITNDTTGFFEDILCSAEELGTNCGPSRKTMLIDGKDEVYFMDTCGNPANIYDSGKINEKIYWKEIFTKEESCNPNSDNAGSSTCGNCDYFLGSIGKKADRKTGSPDYGDFICVGLDCKEGKKHGESWCVKDSPSGDGQDPVGSRYYKHVCINNEVLVEPCADFRNEICLEDSVGGFSEAGCRLNRWQTCTAQKEKPDCGNGDVRDCTWIEGYYFAQTGGIQISTNTTTNGLCVPEYPPGFIFWDQAATANQQAQSAGTGAGNAALGGFQQSASNLGGFSGTTGGSGVCSTGNSRIEIKFEETVPDLLQPTKKEWECKLPKLLCKAIGKDTDPDDVDADKLKDWAKNMNEICRSLGDCGGHVNFVGEGTDEGFAAYLSGDRFAGLGGAETIETDQQTTGAGQQQQAAGGGGGAQQQATS